MEFKKKLVHGHLIKRYKRFLADVVLDDGSEVTAHCTNSGTMKSCLEEGAEVWLSPVDDPRRKTRFTWEMIHINGDWVGINTSNPNTLAFEWVSGGLIAGLEGMTHLKREVKWEDSRFDLYGEGPRGPNSDGAGEPCFIEVKNVTLKDGERALFPDAVTSRGLKHLNTLIRAKQSGIRAVMLYVVQRMDVKLFSMARDIDPAYAKVFDEALLKGVEVLIAQANVNPERIVFRRMLPLELSDI